MRGPGSGMTLRGFEELRARLRVTRGALRSEYLPLAVEETVQEAASTARGYIGQERPEWIPLAAKTIAEKQRLGFVNQVSPTDPLLRTGAMRRSIRAEARGLTGQVTSDDPVALWQDQGTETAAGDVRIPARHFAMPAIMANVGFGIRAMKRAWLRAWGQ
jgi:hypothetical protein